MRAAWKVQGYFTNKLPFHALLFPYRAWFIVCINVFFVLISGYAVFVDRFYVVDLVVNYIVLVVFALLFVFWKVVKKTKMVKLEEMDLVSGRKYIAAQEGSEADDESKEEHVAWDIKGKRYILG
jgi:amino acid transporter